MTFHCFTKRFHAAVLVCLALALPAHAHTGRGPATPEEAAHVAQIATASDRDPVATMTSADGRWFQKWTTGSPTTTSVPTRPLSG